MCKYASSCQLCDYTINIHAEQENMQDININVSSGCPSITSVAGRAITLDAMKELMVPKEKSSFYHLMQAHPHPQECTLYDSVIDAIGKSLGRYCELA